MDIVYEADFESAVMRVNEKGWVYEAARLERDPNQPGVPVLGEFNVRTKRYEGNPEKAIDMIKVLESNHVNRLTERARRQKQARDEARAQAQAQIKEHQEAIKQLEALLAETD